MPTDMNGFGEANSEGPAMAVEKSVGCCRITDGSKELAVVGLLMVQKSWLL